MVHESLDYDEAEHTFIEARHELSTAKRRDVSRRLMLLTVALILILAAIVGSIAFFIVFLVQTLSAFKWTTTDEYWHRGEYLNAFLVTLIFTTALALVAASLTLYAPQSAGSGIPHVKSYLNGNKLIGILRPRTLVAKVIGISCCVAIGLPVGREGPMVHAAACAASITAKAVAYCLRGKIGREHGGFNNDYHRRNFVSMGAAAGVAAAFRAPIGGILFSLEEVRNLPAPP